MVNENTVRDLGYSKDDIEGSSFVQLFMQEERNDDFVQSILDCVEGNKKIEDRIVKYYRDDVCKIIQLRTDFVEEEDMNIGVLVMINDVTSIISSGLNV